MEVAGSPNHCVEESCHPPASPVLKGHMSYCVNPLPSQGFIGYSSCCCLIHSWGSNETLHVRQLVHDKNSASVHSYYYCHLSRELDK